MSKENEVTQLLGKLRNGEMTLEQVADRFRHRRWPRNTRPRPANYQELAARAQEDPEPYVPGSWDDVADAYFAHELDEKQYRVLADAVAEAKRAEDRGEL